MNKRFFYAVFSLAIFARCIETRAQPNSVDSIPEASFRFGGPVGARVDANIREWIFRAPRSNPALLEMFAMRDRLPEPQLLDWSGEFAGKYLISAVQAMRETGDPQLKEFVQSFVNELISLQAEDGYLGPFPKRERMVGHWDLWGHYHILQGLLRWYDVSGDKNALAAARKIGDLICRIYLDTGKRVIDAGFPEMNMAIVHGLAMLYRETNEPRYLKLALETVKDFERAGDYLRTGLAGTDFFRIPKPRWESLHSIQGMAELYRATGDKQYRDAFLNHWRSILRFDIHNNGSFSSGEQATGDPYLLDAPIETCCSVAWQAITIDALRLTGDSTIADELERTTLNAIAGAQHPSGAWCTYDTPMNGQRRASHHDIVFQSRPGAPDLTCCSTNGPRGLGALGEWAVMSGPDDGLFVNYYGALDLTLLQNKADGQAITLKQTATYPAGDTSRIVLDLAGAKRFPLSLRIPAWSKRTKVSVNGQPIDSPTVPGKYLVINREWHSGDAIDIVFDMALRYEAGDRDAGGMVSIFRGPLLLAYDQACNAFDEKDIPLIDAAHLATAEPGVEIPVRDGKVNVSRYTPWVFVTLPGVDGRPLRLCDFASAGAGGTHYRSWLQAVGARPAPPASLVPADGAAVAPGAILFTARQGTSGNGATLRVELSDTPTFDTIILKQGSASNARLIVSAEAAKALTPERPYFWRLVSQNGAGEQVAIGLPKRLTINPKLPPVESIAESAYGERPADGLLVEADLAGGLAPAFGTLATATGWTAASADDHFPGAIETDGKLGVVTYGVTHFPEYDYSASVWVRPASSAAGLHEIFSAWRRPSDDPLRVCIENGQMFARLETTQGGYSTAGITFTPGEWHHVAAVKSGLTLTLYIDGKPAASTRVPFYIESLATDIGLGGNPHHTPGAEALGARFAQLRVYARALTAVEIAKLATVGRQSKSENP